MPVLTVILHKKACRLYSGKLFSCYSVMSTVQFTPCIPQNQHPGEQIILHVLHDVSASPYLCALHITVSTDSNAFSYNGSIMPASFASDFSIADNIGFVTGCFATNVVQQSS